jgi:hypothetical protein
VLHNSIAEKYPLYLIWVMPAQGNSKRFRELLLIKKLSFFIPCIFVLKKSTVQLKIFLPRLFPGWRIVHLII